MEAERVMTVKKSRNPLLEGKGPLYRILWYAAPYLMLFAFLLGWEWVSTRGTVVFPTPVSTLKRLVTVWGTRIAKKPMIYHVWVSMRRVLLALAISVLFGVPLGVFMGWNRTFRAIMKPLFEIVNPIPPIAWVPLITLWFGTGEVPRLIIIILGVFKPIVINSYAGVAMVEPLNIKVGTVFGASGRHMLTDVVLPSSLDAIFAGIRNGIGGGWMVLLAAEMLAARSGLGFLIQQGSNADDLELSLVGMTMIALFGIVFAYGFDYVERWLCPWKKK